MKRFYTIALAVTLLLCCCVGCGQKAPDVSNPVVSGGDVSTSTTTTTTTVEDVSGEDTTTGTEDTTTGTNANADTTTGQSVTTSGTKDTTSGTKDTTTGTKGTSGTKNTTTGTKGTTTTKKTTVTTTTTTKKTVNNLFGTTTSNGGGGLTTQSTNGSNAGYEFDPGDEWELYWNDEFNGTTLDESKWSYEVGKSGIYTEKAENVTVQNGNLVLTARHANPKDNQGVSFTTGAVNSAHKFSFRYGRLEFRARLPYGEGVFPALWTLGDYYLTTSDEKGWPRCGEIDVMQFIGVGGETDRNTRDGRDIRGLDVYAHNKIGNNWTTCNLHWGVDRQHHESSGADYCLPKGIFADDFHVFAIEWTEEKIEWYVDDDLIHTVDIRQPSMLDTFHKPHWIILSLNLVEDWEPRVKDVTPFPQTMYVDYIRVLAPEKK